MKRRSLLVLGLSGIAAAACRPLVHAGSPTRAAPVAPEPVADRLLLRQADGGISAIDASGAPLYSLPPGLASSDWSRWVTLSPATDRTSVGAFDPRSGSAVGQLELDGRFDDVAISRNAQLLLLVGGGSDASQRPIGRMQVVELAGGHVRSSQQLGGSFSADAVDDRGAHVYLIEHQPWVRPNAYKVVHYDTLQQRFTGEVADKTGAETMSGYRLEQAWSPSGEWLYSLYLSPGDGSAFIHALNVSGGWAACLDLPASGQPEDRLRPYSLALDATTQLVYAVNPALGTLSAFRVGDLQLRSYALSTASGTSTAGALAVSPDGATLYVPSADGVLALAARRPDQPGLRWLAGAPTRSVAVSPDGQRLYALGPESLSMLDLQSGQQRSLAPGDFSTTVGIERVLPAA